MAVIDGLDYVLHHAESDTWICDHGSVGAAISFTNPLRVGVVYLFVLSPQLDPGWKRKGAKNLKVLHWNMKKPRPARSLEVTLQELPVVPILPARTRVGSSDKYQVPQSIRDNDPAIQVTPKQFRRIQASIKVGRKPVALQPFAYPALIRIDMPTRGTVKAQLLWGRYDPDNPAFIHILRTQETTQKKHPFAMLTAAGREDKFAAEFDRTYQGFIGNYIRWLRREIPDIASQSKYIALNPALFRLTLQPSSSKEQQAVYDNISRHYYQALKEAGENSVRGKVWRNTHLAFIRELIHNTVTTNDNEPSSSTDA